MRSAEPARRARRAGRMRRVAAALVALTLALVAAACGGSSTSGSGVRSKKDLSIVVLGDSVAVGEGIAYGYT